MSAYYQVLMQADHVKYSTFQAPSGLYEYLVLPMSVSNPPATMHQLTSSFRDLKNTRSLYDDIYIITKSTNVTEHLVELRKVLKVLEDNQLCIKLAKCAFCADEIPCLGDFVGRDGMRIDPDKVKTIREWPVPLTQDELHSFLGLAGFVQRFCEPYADLTASLFSLVKKKDKKNSKTTLDKQQVKNFQEPKQRLSKTPVLHLPEFSKLMYLRTDASQFAVGGVLFQVVDGIERPIAFKKWKMKPGELKYPTQQQELLAIVDALAAFRIYCLDKPVIIETDHSWSRGFFRKRWLIDHLRGGMTCSQNTSRCSHTYQKPRLDCRRP